MNELRPLIDTRWGMGTVHTAVSSARLNKAATAKASIRGMEILLGSGLSPEQELEADRVGTRLLELAGYHAATLRNHVRHLRHQQAATTSAAHAMPRVLDHRLAMLETMLSDKRLSGRRSPLGQDVSPVAYVGHNF